MEQELKRCKAKSKRTGEQCQQMVTPGYEVCYYHGANGGAPKGNKNALKHGAYVNELITEEEHELYNQFFEKLHKDFVINESSDQVACELAGIYFIRLLRALKNEDFELISRIDSLLRTHLRDLKATKEKREGEIVNIKTSPAEWAANLLARRRAEKEKTAETEKNSRICEKKPEASA